MVGGRLVFDRQADGRTKTGRAAIGTLSARTERLVNAYFTELQIDLHPDGVLFRTRTGNAYGRDTLAHDFAAVRALAFPRDKRRLMDMRRSGVVEAVAGDAGVGSETRELDRPFEYPSQDLCAGGHRGSAQYRCSAVERPAANAR
jgi:hypothetical protein